MLLKLAEERGRQVSTRLFGQDINGETYASILRDSARFCEILHDSARFCTIPHDSGTPLTPMAGFPRKEPGGVHANSASPKETRTGPALRS